MNIWTKLSNVFFQGAWNVSVHSFTDVEDFPSAEYQTLKIFNLFLSYAS